MKQTVEVGNRIELWECNTSAVAQSYFPSLQVLNKCKVGMVASFHNPSTLETEAGRSGVVGYAVMRLSEKTKTDSVNECFCVTMKFF